MKLKKILLGSIATSSILFAGGDIVPNIEETVVIPEVIQASSAWEHQLTIYGWLPTFDGTLTYQIPGEPDEESDFSMIDELDAVFMASYEVRKDKWSFLADMIYLGLSGGEIAGEGTPLETSFDEEFTAWLLSFYGGYNVIHTGNTTLDIIAGMRYLSMDIDAKIDFPGSRLPSVNLSPSVEVYDAVVGVKGSIDISENWYIPYLFDIGGGDSDLTWQGQASIGYRFGWGDVLATYRYVHYEKDGLKLVEDFDLYGPKVGVVFHF